MHGLLAWFHSAHHSSSSSSTSTANDVDGATPVEKKQGPDVFEIPSDDGTEIVNDNQRSTDGYGNKVVHFRQEDAEDLSDDDGRIRVLVPCSPLIKV